MNRFTFPNKMQNVFPGQHRKRFWSH